MTTFLLLAIAAATAGNPALARLAGIPPLLATARESGAVTRPAVAAGVALAVAALACFALEHWLLAPAGLAPLRLAGYLGLAWVAVRLAAAVADRDLPVPATTGTVLAVALLVVPGLGSPAAALATAVGAGSGYAALLVVFAALLPRLARARAPAAFRGAPLAVATVALLALAVVGFTGVGS